MKPLAWPCGSLWTLAVEMHISVWCPRGAPITEGLNLMAKKLKKGKKIAAKKSLRSNLYIK
jgi:hypothetical protein